MLMLSNNLNNIKKKKNIPSSSNIICYAFDSIKIIYLYYNNEDTFALEYMFI